VDVVFGAERALPGGPDGVLERTAAEVNRFCYFCYFPADVFSCGVVKNK
jgi:hypothetical protein